MSFSDLRRKIETKELNVAIVGFGYIGTCIGAAIAHRGFGVVGIDARGDIVGAINRGAALINEPRLSQMVKNAVAAKKLTASTSYEPLARCDVVVVTVGTPLSDNAEPDTADIVSATRSISALLKDGHLVILKSTVPPMLTERIVKPILDGAGKRYFLAFSPERLAEGRAIADLETVPMVIGGIDAESSGIAAQFWRGTLGLETIQVDNTKTAELVKLADNLWIDLNIAVANELAVLSDKLGIDALQVIAAANTLIKGAKGQRVNILAPSIGVGGYCLTKDPWFVHHLGRQWGVELKTPVTSRTVNDSMPAYSFSLMKRVIESTGRTLATSRIAILGIAFNNNTGDCRYTPTKPIVQAFKDSGADTLVCDPLVREEDAREVTDLRLVADPLAAIEGADAIVFLTAHDIFKQIPVSAMISSLKPRAIIIDGRNFFDRASIAAVCAAGLTYKGIGR